MSPRKILSPAKPPDSLTLGEIRAAVEHVTRLRELRDARTELLALSCTCQAITIQRDGCGCGRRGSLERNQQAINEAMREL